MRRIWREKTVEAGIYGPGNVQRENGLYEYRYNDSVTGKMDVNTLFERYIEARKLADQTRENYIRMWNCHVKDEIGRMKVVEVRPSHVKLFYARLSEAGYSRSTIKLLHDMLTRLLKWRWMMIS